MEPIFISLDVEADGPSPAINNCLQIALVACRYHPDPNPEKPKQWVVDKLDLCLEDQEDRNPDKQTMEEFWSRFPNVLEKIRDNANDPAWQMLGLSNWLKKLSKEYIITKWVAAPGAYDWQWINSIYYSYLPPYPYPLPFKCECMSSILATLGYMGHRFDKIKDELYPGLECLPHTHYALDDALEQAYKYLCIRKFIRENLQTEHCVIEERIENKSLEN